MKKYLTTSLLGFFVFAGFTPQSQAEGWYVGGGIQGVSFEDELDDIDSGNGVTFSGGFRSDELFSAELLVGGSFHEDAIFDEDVFQFSVLAGAKLSSGSDTVQPFVVAGISLNVVDFDDVDNFDEISGVGLYWGIGLDVFLADQHALNIGYRSNSWDGENDDFDFDVTTDMVTIAYTFHFSR